MSSLTPTNDWDCIADVYDDYVRVTFDVPFFLEEARQSPGPVLELMVGTGRVSIPLLEAGISLTAVDRSAEMLGRLRAKLAARGLAADIRQMDVRELEIAERFALALIPFQSLSEVLDRSERRSVIERVSRHLVEDGRLVCTLHNPAVRFQSMNGQVRVLGTYALEDGGTLVLQGAQTLDVSTNIATMLQLLEAYDEAGHLRSKRLMIVRFAAISRLELESDAAAAGFEVEALFGDYDRRPFDEATSPFLIWRLRKGRTRE